MSKNQSHDRLCGERNIALCYVRQSITRDANDTNSPTRQRANIQAMCDKHGWIAEWYEDTGGHKSGRSEKGRPAWLNLKRRLGDSDVIALVANDLSRLHRKGWRVGDLLEYLDENDVNLVLAAPGREIDTTTTKGRMLLQFGAIFDEYYAEDVSQRAKDSVAYRKKRGISIGMPPFGTVRNEDGYLKATPEGAWLLSDGTFIAGLAEDQLPQPDAIWRGYYEAAERALGLYAQGDIGNERIAYTLNEEGFAYRDRAGQPRNFWRDDIRRIIANWPEYGGLVFDRKAKDRPAYENLELNNLALNPDRSVFPVQLIMTVAEVRQQRSIRPPDRSKKIKAYPYPLSAITYCAHCEQIARERNNPKLRSPLSGSKYIDGSQRYKHRLGVKCSSKNRSVRRETFEAEFRRLLGLITIKPEAMSLMMELAIQADQVRGTFRDETGFEEEKAAAIALCQKRIEAAVNLYADGMINRDEYLRRVEANNTEISHWQIRTTETEKLATELALCVDVVDKLERLWDLNDDEDRQGLVRSLFVEIIYNLDTQRIVDFKLKPWTDRFLTLRSALYENETSADNASTLAQGIRNDVPHREFESLFWP
jgi:DNA invertase Pin-like site-specific DNA recombinase